MNRALTFATTAALWCSFVSLGTAEDTKATKAPDDKRVAAMNDGSANSELWARLHRTMAALIEARSAEEPDQAKIDTLVQELRQICATLQSQAAAAAPAPDWTSPRGGPGMGFGRGPGWGGGQGQGWGRGAGPGWGRGPGGGAGRGFGPGGGVGLAPGGPWFVDRDEDAICDNYEVRHGLHR